VPDVRISKLRRTEGTGNLRRMGKIINMYRILVEKSERQRPPKF
jgi:hypothetical protein